MAYGTVKVDNVTFTYNSADATTTFSGFYASTTNNLTLSGTASAATFTGTTANFTNTNAQNISVTTLLSGLAITGGTAGFTIVTGTTVTGTTANFVTVSGTTVTGTTAQFTSITGGTAGFTTITGTTVTGTTANFVTVSGTTVTGTTASFTSGIFTSLSGTTHTITSGVFALGTAALPSISFVSDPNTGIYSPGADQVAVATNGVERVEFGTTEVVFNDGGTNYDFRVEGDTSTHLLFVDASTDCIGIGIPAPSQRLDVAGTIQSTNTTNTVGQTADVILSTANTNFGNVYSATLQTVLNNTTTGANDFFIKQFNHNSGSIYEKVFQANSGNSGYVALYTVNTERLRLTSTGTLNFVGAGTAGSTQAVSFNGSAPVDSLVINSGGNVGIGTSLPGGLFHVSGGRTLLSSSDGYELAFARVGNYFYFYNDGGNQTGKLSLTTTAGAGGGEIITFTQDTKRVGIGTTGPQNPLVISNGGANGFEISSATNSGTTSYLLSYNRSTSAYTDLRFDASAFRFEVSASEKARIDSSGNLLVGGTSNTAGSRILAENASGDQIAIRYTGIATYYLNTTSGGDLAINKDASERLRIDSSGRLLVGTTTTTSAGELLRVKKASTGTDGAGINFEGSYSLDDDASQTVSIASSSLITITNENELQGALLFATYASATITIISDPSNIIATSDTDTKLCLFKSANTSNVTVKNRLGANKSILIGRITT